jgi:hypothetical protein
MPVFKFVTVCEKVIIDQAGPVSLIALFQKMRIQLQDAPLPEKAISQTRWHVFCLWENDPKEIGQTFTQILKVFNVDGSVFSEYEMPFVNNTVGDTQTKFNILFNALPIWQEGNIVIRVWLKGTEKEVGECQFAVEYMPKQSVDKTVEPPASGPAS